MFSAWMPSSIYIILYQIRQEQHKKEHKHQEERKSLTRCLYNFIQLTFRTYIIYHLFSQILVNGWENKVKILEEKNRKLRQAYDDLKEILDNEIERQAMEQKMNVKRVNELNKKILEIEAKF